MAETPVKNTFPILIAVLAASLALYSTVVSAGAKEEPIRRPQPVPNLTGTPESAVKGYITAYLHHDFSAVCYFDAVISAAIERQLDSSAEKTGSGTYNSAMKPQMEMLLRNARNKQADNNYAPFTKDGRAGSGLIPLHEALYPGMRFRIAAGHDGKLREKVRTVRQCASEITVELNYPDAGNAPRHNGKQVKKAFIRVCLREVPPVYRVVGFLPVRQGWEYFR